MKVKRLNEDAVLPKYAKHGDSGFDLVAVENTFIEPGETKLIKTGLAFDIPMGYEIQVRPRSGISLKTKLRVVLGTVDSGYKGEVGVIVDNIYHDCLDDGEFMFKPSTIDEEVAMNLDHTIFGTYIIRKGDRIAQAILAPVSHTTFEEVNELSDSERGINGYGSTGMTANVDQLDENGRYKQALEFYADEEKYFYKSMSLKGHPMIIKDGGIKARQALKEGESDERK